MENIKYTQKKRLAQWASMFQLAGFNNYQLTDNFVSILPPSAHYPSQQGRIKAYITYHIISSLYIPVYILFLKHKDL